MALSSDLLSQFAKITNDNKKTVEETTVYGTAVEYNGGTYVRLDGSELLTPIATTATVKAGERVTVMIKNHTATVTGNLSSPSARINDVNEIAGDVVEFNTVLANKVDTLEFNAERARINTLVVDNATIKNKLAANEAEITNIQAANVNVAGKISSAEAEIEILKANKLDVKVADLTYATIKELEAVDADIRNLEADVADIDTLIFGSASGSVIQTSFANAVIAQLGDAQIKSAMIEDVSASKIVSGDIITNNVRVRSEDGLLLISDETIQISDNSRVRVQIGKDAANDYSINIWDADGNLMFSKGGITDSAIKDAIIRNDMVSDTANISAHKINIDSLFEEINGSTKNIKSTRVYLDDQAQTLDVAFKEMTTEVDNLSSVVSSQGTEIGIIQGQITSKVWQQDINSATNQMSTQYSTLEQELNGITATVASHSTEIDSKADSSTVIEVSDRVTSVANRTTAVENKFAGYSTTEQMNSAITQSANSITSSVSQTYTTKTEFAELDIGGRNLIAGTDNATEYVGNMIDGNGTYKDVWTGKTIDIPTATDYIVSFDAKADVAQNIRCHFFSPNTTLTSLSSTGQYKTGATDGLAEVSITTEWARYWVKWTQTPADTRKNVIVGRNSTENDIYIRAVKLEVGNKATAWTPAPEDMATGKELTSVDNTLETTRTRMTEAESLIQQLSESIMTLVTDGNGASLMVQTESGWTFSTGQIQDMVNTTAENLNSLTNEMGDVNTSVDALKQAVDDLGVLNDYVKIGIYENEPCIELGESDSDFKLMITNTRIMFREGSSTPAYINNQSLFISKAVIEEELQQGEFVWKARSNGNLGLIWKGVTS